MVKKMLAMLLALLLLCAAAMADELVVVGDGNSSSEHVPFNPYCFDFFTKGNIFYSKNYLTGLKKGDTITAMTFDISETYGSSTDTCEMYLMEVATFDTTQFQDVSAATNVFTGTLNSSQIGPMRLDFQTPYTYQGGNLLILTQNTTSGAWVTVKFACREENSNVYISGFGSPLSDILEPDNRGKLLPNLTITYTPVPAPAPAPETGDGTPIAVLCAALVLSAAAFLALSKRRAQA